MKEYEGHSTGYSTCVPRGARTRYPLPVTRYPFPVTRYPLPVTRYPLPVTRYPFPVSRFPFPVSRFPFPVARALGVRVARKAKSETENS
jgi:hypothetical protein